VTEVLTSNLLKSNCLVTGQPDWGSVQIRYSGPQIDQGGLLRYIVSFRNHNEFHEQCVERIFMDIWRAASPSSCRSTRATPAAAGWTSTPFAPATRSSCRRTPGPRGNKKAEANYISLKEPSAARSGNTPARLSFMAITDSRTCALLQIAPCTQPICLSESSTEWSRV
jgi:hypothetical protein